MTAKIEKAPLKKQEVGKIEGRTEAIKPDKEKSLCMIINRQPAKRKRLQCNQIKTRQTSRTSVHRQQNLRTLLQTSHKPTIRAIWTHGREGH